MLFFFKCQKNKNDESGKEDSKITLIEQNRAKGKNNE